MRRLTAIAAAVLFAVTACSTGGDDDPKDPGTNDAATEPAPSPTAHLAVTEPFQLNLTTPSNFEPTGNDRGVLVTDNHLSYDFHLIDGSEHSRLTVTTYLFPEDVEIADREAQLALVLAYDDSRGNVISPEKHYGTLVHGYEGIYRFASLAPGGKTISQQNHYLFAGQHLIQITCQWEYDFEEVYAGCQELLELFTYPEEWPLPGRVEA